eukprot:8953008-Lingulodinium_polyedra.AAC.1
MYPRDCPLRGIGQTLARPLAQLRCPFCRRRSSAVSVGHRPASRHRFRCSHGRAPRAPLPGMH